MINIEEQYSLLPLTKKTDKDIDKAVREKIRNHLADLITKKFDFEINLLAIGYPYIYVGSHNYGQSIDTENAEIFSTIYQYHPHNAVCTEFISKRTSLAYLEVIQPINKLFVSYKGNICSIVDTTTADSIFEFRSDGPIVKVLPTVYFSKIFYCTANAIMSIDLASQTFKTTTVSELDKGIASFDMMQSSNAFLILSEDKKVRFFHLEKAVLTNFSDLELINPVKSFLVMNDSGLFSLQFDAHIELWKIRKDLRTEKSSHEPSSTHIGQSSTLEKQTPSPDMLNQESESRILTEAQIPTAQNRNVTFEEGNIPESKEKGSQAEIAFDRVGRIDNTGNFYPYYSEREQIFIEQVSPKEIKFLNLKGHYLSQVIETKKLIVQLRYCPFSNLLVYTDGTHNVVTLELSKERYLRLGMHSDFQASLLDQSESTLYTFSSTRIKKWNISSNQCLCIAHHNVLQTNSTVELFEEEKMLICGGASKELRIYNTDDLALKDKMPIDSDDNAFIAVKSFRKSLLLVTANLNSSLINIWNMKDQMNKTTIAIKSDYTINELCVSQKYEMGVCSLEDHSLVLFDSAKILEANVKGHTKRIDSLLMADEIDKLISGSSNEIIVWSFPSLTIVHAVMNENAVGNMALIDNNRMLLVWNNSDHLTLWRTEKMSLVYKFQTEPGQTILSFRYAKNTGKLIIIDGDLMISVKTLEPKIFPKITKEVATSVKRMAACPKSENIYTLDNQGTLARFDNKNLEMLNSSVALPSGVESEIVISEPLELICLNHNDQILFFDLHTLEPKGTIKTDVQIHFITLMDNQNHIVSSHSKGMVKLWDIPTNKLLRKTVLDKADEVFYMCTHAPSKTLYASGARKIYYTNYERRLNFSVFYSNSEYILYFCKSEKRGILAAAFENKNIKFWNCHDGQLIKSIYTTSNIQQISFKDDQNIFLTVNELRSLEVWEINNFEQINIKLHPNIESAYAITNCASTRNLVLVYANENDGKAMLSTMDSSSIWKLSYIEEWYLRSRFLKQMSTNEYITSFRHFQYVYTNSILLTAYFNIYLAATINKHQQALKYLYKEENFPFEFNDNQINPLLYSIKRQNIGFLKALILFLTKNNISITIDEESAEYLLTMKFGQAFLSRNYKLVNKFFITEANIEKEGSFKSITIMQQPFNYFNEQAYDKTISAKKVEATDIELYDLSMRWDFTNFTRSSILFLNEYAHSDCDEFILSPFRHIITHKWNTYFWYFMIHTILFWAHVIFYYLFFTNPEYSILLDIDLALLILIALYEIVDICSNWRNYLSDKWNYFDLFTIIVCMTFLMLARYDKPILGDQEFRILLVFSMVVICLRAFTYFKIFPHFTYITQMTISMIANSLTIVAIVIYFIVCLSVMLTKSTSHFSFTESLVLNYNLIYGNIPGDIEQRSILSIILIVIGSVLLPIFLVNFLIAKLSGTYSKLENRERVLAFKEKAGSALEFERIMFFLQKTFGRISTSLYGYIYLGVDLDLIWEEEETSDTERMLQTLIKEQQNQTQKLVHHESQLTEIRGHLKSAQKGRRYVSDKSNSNGSRQEIKQMKKDIEELKTMMRELLSKNK